MAALTGTSQDIYNALNTRLLELGHALSPSHLWALTTDVIATIQQDTANVVAHAATDSALYKPPAHNKF